MIDRLLKFVVSRFVVRPRGFRLSVRYLKAFLREHRNFERVDQIPDSVALLIAQEAWRRAAAREKDGRARYGMFDRELESAADSIVAAFNGDQEVDPRIKGILSFNNLL